MDFPFADMDIPAVIGVLTGFGLVVVVPIIGMLLAHQRRMAELVHGQQAQKTLVDERIVRLEREVHELKQQVVENIIAVDDRRQHIQALSTPPPMPEASSQPHQAL